MKLGGSEINTKKRNFDQEAASWDQVPRRVKVAQDIAQSIIREISLTLDIDIMDFGCGTGLLTFSLQPFVRSIPVWIAPKGCWMFLKQR